jgi:hypothetical protein
MKFNDHLAYFTYFSYILWPFGIVWGSFGIFSSFGIFYQEKSGNPVLKLGRIDRVQNGNGS